MQPLSLPCVLLVSACLAHAAAPEFSDVFTSGKEGYKSIRIPSVVVSKQGTVLAFAEGRAVATDQAENDILLRRSTDGGRTWGPLQVLHEDGKHSLNNPTAVVERQGGRIFLMYQRIPGHLKEHSRNTATGYEGTNIYSSLLITSDDDGVTWTRPLDVTRGTKRATNATTLATGPGIGIQLTRGAHQGRIIMPFNEGPYYQWNNYAAFSDDRGATWKFGGNVPAAFVPDARLGTRSQINEVQMVELSDGSVRLSSRQFAGAKVRKTSISRDGGATWSPVADVPELRDPSCNASILRYSFDDGAGQGIVLHSGPDSTKRDSGTVHLSRDDGATWPVKRVLWPGGFAYSVLTKLGDGTVGCLFEADGYQRLVFARFPLSWVTGADNAAVVPEGRTETTGKFGWWPARHAAKIETTRAGGIELAFLGDSITQSWETQGRAVWERFYGPRRAANYGFGGDSTQHVLWRLDHGEFDGLAPKVIVLLIGTNNARHGDGTPDEIAAGVRAVLGRLADKCPRSKVLLLGILPRGAAPGDAMRLKCDQVNALLPALADGDRVHFLNINGALLQPDGTLPKAIAPDQLHLSAQGYERWAAAMESRLQELLAGRG